MAKSIKINVVFKTAMSIVNLLFPILTVPYVSRVLSVGDFTEYQRVVSVLAWFSPFAVFGVYTYGMRTISQVKGDRDKVNELFSKLFFMSTFASVFVTAVYLFMVFNLGLFSENRNFYVIAAVQLLCTCFATDWLNEAYESYGFMLVKTFICRLAYCISVFVFIKEENDGIIYIALTTASFFLNNTLTFAYGKKHVKFSRFKIKEIAPLLKSLFIVFLLVNSSMLYTVFDRFMLTVCSTKMELTFYTIGQTISNTIFQITSSLVLVTIPRLSYFWANSRDEFIPLLKKTSSFFLLLNIPCCIGLALVSRDVMYLYSGTKYLEGFFVLSLFSVRYLISAYDAIYSKQIFLTTGNESSLTEIYYIGGFYNIIMKIILWRMNFLNAKTCVITTATADILIIALEINKAKKLGIYFKILSRENMFYVFLSALFIPAAFFFGKLFGGLRPSIVFLRVSLTIATCFAIYLIGLLAKKDELAIYCLEKVKRKKGFK